MFPRICELHVEHKFDIQIDDESLWRATIWYTIFSQIKQSVHAWLMIGNGNLLLFDICLWRIMFIFYVTRQRSKEHVKVLFWQCKIYVYIEQAINYGKDLTKLFTLFIAEKTLYIPLSSFGPSATLFGDSPHHLVSTTEIMFTAAVKFVPHM